AVAAAAAAWLLMRGRPETGEYVKGEPWRGSGAHLSVIGHSEGLDRCDPTGKACSKLSDGASIPAGSRLPTDAVTRATLKMSDGSALALDRSTSVILKPDSGRSAQLIRGGVVADVAHRE